MLLETLLQHIDIKHILFNSIKIPVLFLRARSGSPVCQCGLSNAILAVSGAEADNGLALSVPEL